MERVPARSHRLRGRWLAVAILAMMLLLAGWGVVAGLRAADASAIELTPDRRTEILGEARDFWNHPVERATFLSMAVTGEWGRMICLDYEVTAYTFFGLRASQIQINCHGTVTRLATSWPAR